MEFFVKPTVSGVNSLIVAIQYDYNSTINMLKKSFNIEKVSQLVKSNLWVALHTKEASKKNYSLYVHKFTGCNIKVYSKKDNPDLEKMVREWGGRNAAAAGFAEGRLAEAFKIINTNKTEPLKLYTIYSPPQHKPNEITKRQDE